MQLLHYINVIGLMLRRDLISIRTAFKSSIINAFIWLTITVGIKIYILPFFGVTEVYGSMVLVGSIAAIANMEINHRMMFFAQNMVQDRAELNYDLLLPIPAWVVFVERAIFFAISGMAISAFVLPIGKVLFWNRVDLSAISLLRFIPFFFLLNIAFGFFALFLASRIRGMQSIINTWLRIILPLWFLGGFEFSWYSFRAMVPSLAYINLLNHFTYITEGLRSAVFGPTDYIPFWICVSFLIGFIVVVSWFAVRNLQRYLDTV
ncbi:MAG TPA: hypothetical protein QGF02_03460 [Candidatus Babeliales bacterium]|nr:hypothetical protein [Candidatus Babeliales bacterium]